MTFCHNLVAIALRIGVDAQVSCSGVARILIFDPDKTHISYAKRSEYEKTTEIFIEGNMWSKIAVI